MNAAQNENSLGTTDDAPETTATDVATSLASGTSGDTAEKAANDATRAPEEESQSEIPGDPRPPHQTQPPTKEQY